MFSLNLPQSTNTFEMASRFSEDGPALGLSSKIVSLGLSRVGDPSPRLPTNRAELLQLAKQAISEEVLGRERMIKEKKRLDEIHPFEAAPMKILLRKPKSDEAQYDGFFIGSADASREDKLKAKEDYKRRILEDISAQRSLKVQLDSDEGIPRDRKPYTRKVSVEPDIDSSCALLRLGGGDDEKSNMSKRQVNREIMLDNIATANSKPRRGDRLDTGRPSEFFIGADPEEQKRLLKEERLQYKVQLDQDTSPRRDAPKRIGRLRQDEDDRYINYSGLTGLSIGNAPESMEGTRIQQQLYKDQLDEQIERSNHFKAIRREQSKQHFTGRLPFLQETR